jgi:NADPH:quinone reductase-like Zn-dependent oxidoreductase
MRVYEVVKGATGIDGLKQAERPDPKPGRGEVLVRVRATALNFRDLAVVMGVYPGPPGTGNVIPLSDGAGEVVETGEDVNRFKTGDRVAATFFKGYIAGPPRQFYAALGGPGVDGMLAEYVVAAETDLVRLPDSFSFEDGAALPCAAVTAWHALMVAGGPIKPGDTVLTLGTGGVSMFAVQFAKAAGARIVTTSSSDEKLERAQKHGSHILINYKRTPEWGAEVMKLTGGHGADCVVEVGGSGTLAQSFQAVAMGGKVSLIGVLTGPGGDTNPHGLMFKAASLHGIFVGNRTMFEDMLDAMVVNRIKPIIGKVFPFEDAAAAYQYQQAAKHFGKVVIKV